MLSCIRYKKLLLPYAEDALDVRLKSKLETHVAKCRKCSEELAELRMISRTLLQSDVPAAEPASDLWMRVQSAITEPEARKRPWWQLPSYQVASAVGAASILLFAVLAVHSPIHYEETAPLRDAPMEAKQAEPQQNRVPQVQTEAVEPQANKPVAVDDGQKNSIPSRIGWYEGPVHKVDSSAKREKAAPQSKALPKKGHDFFARTFEPSPAPAFDSDRSYNDSSIPETTAVPEATRDRSPFTQAGRIPGGSQAQVQPGRPDELKATGGIAGVESKKRAVNLGTPTASSGDSDADKKDTSHDAVRVASAPSAATGSVTNVGPPLLGDKASAARGQKPAGSDKVIAGASVTPTEENIRENEKLLKSKPNDVHTMRALSMAYKAKGLPVKQIEMLEKISKAQPDNAANWLELGKAYEQAGKKDKARSALKKASEKGNEQIKKEAEVHLKKLDAKQ